MPMYTGGRYCYKKFELNVEGDRIAQRCFREQNPDLQSTYFYNYDASEVLRFLRIDLDAKNTIAEYLDENGAISWKKIAHKLKEDFPELLRQIEYVTISHGKKGLHLVMGLSPLPLNDKTLPTQNLARKVQSEIITILNFLGIGADEAGKGLKQDFSTFRNASNVVHHNKILTKKIENLAKHKPYQNEEGVIVYPVNSRPRILNDLSKTCDKLLKTLQIKNGYRLYNDLRVEKPIAKLFLFTLGMYKQDLQIASNTFFAWTNEVELSIDEIEFIMETSRRNFANYITSEEFNELFHITKVSGLFETGRYRISIKDKICIDKRIKRALQVLSSVSSSINFRLIPPELVSDGMKNSAIVSWALALKWQGVSQELACVKIQDLVKRIPGYEDSKSCKKSQLRATVSSVYRNKRELCGSRASELLPDWLDASNAKVLSVKSKLTNTSSTRSLSRSILSLAKECSVLNELSPVLNLVPILQGVPGDPKIKTVSYKHRVGFFFNNELILIVIRNRHYKLTKIIEHIESNILKRDKKFDVLKDVIHLRHNTKEYFELSKQLYSYDDDKFAIKAQHICGLKKSFAESLSEFKFKKSIPFEEHLKIHDGYDLEYDENMFVELAEA